jgi:hypothetical protein
MMDDFTDHPLSVAEIRANRSEECHDWTPRDALISVLRELDSGERDIDTLIVCWRERHKDGKETGHFRQAAQDVFINLGLLATTAFKMQD